MTNPIAWLRAKVNDWRFRRAFNRAPVKLLGDMPVKEVMGNLYVVTLEVLPSKKVTK